MRHIVGAGTELIPRCAGDVRVHHEQWRVSGVADVETDAPGFFGDAPDRNLECFLHGLRSGDVAAMRLAGGHTGSGTLSPDGDGLGESHGALPRNLFGIVYS